MPRDATTETDGESSLTVFEYIAESEENRVADYARSICSGSTLQFETYE